MNGKTAYLVKASFEPLDAFLQPLDVFLLLPQLLLLLIDHCCKLSHTADCQYLCSMQTCSFCCFSLTTAANYPA